MGVTMKSSLGLHLLLLFTPVAPMNIRDLWIPPDCTTCPDESCCPDLPTGGKQTCCPAGNGDFQCCPIENATCCPDWDGPEGPTCCSSVMQCAPNGSPFPCMAKNPVIVTFHGGLNLTSSFPASDDPGPEL